MGYLRAWKQNLALLAAAGLILIVAAIAVIIFHRGGPGPGYGARHLEFIVTGTAPRGVAVSEESGRDPAHVRGFTTGAQVLAEAARLPYRLSVPVGANQGFFEFQAKLIGAGRIRCTIEVGSLRVVKEAAGEHGACTPGVAHGQFGTAWHAG